MRLDGSQFCVICIGKHTEDTLSEPPMIHTRYGSFGTVHGDVAIDSWLSALGVRDTCNFIKELCMSEKGMAARLGDRCAWHVSKLSFALHDPVSKNIEHKGAKFEFTFHAPSTQIIHCLFLPNVSKPVYIGCFSHSTYANEVAYIDNRFEVGCDDEIEDDDL